MIDTYELLVKYPWRSAFSLGLLSFFLGAVARPMGLLDKRRYRPSQTMARTPEAFWEIVISSAVLVIIVGSLFHLIRAHRRATTARNVR